MAVRISAIFICVTLSFCNGNILEIFRGGDLPSAFAIRLMTLVVPDKGNNVQITFDRWKTIKGINKRFIRVNSVGWSSFVLTAHDRGAVFVQANHLNFFNITQLVQRSGASTPIFLYSLNETRMPEFLKDIGNIPYKSRLFVILRSAKQEQGLTLQEIYHVLENDTNLLVNTIGERFVTGDKPTWKFDKTSHFQRRSNLQGTTVRLLYPSFMFAEVDYTGLATISWYVEKYARMAMYTLNTSVTSVTMHENVVVGEPNEEGRWTGTVGALQRSEADLSIIGLNPSAILMEAIDMTASYAAAGYKLYIRKPEVTYSLLTMLSGFTLGTWLACVLLLLVLAVALFLVSSCTLKAGMASGPPFQIGESLLIVLGDYCVKGWERIPNSKSGFILCFSSVVFGYLINMLYVSKLQANLTVDTAPMPFTDLEGLASTKTYNLLVFDGSLPHEAIMHAESGTLKQLKEIIDRFRNSVFGSYVDAMKRLCTERAAVWGLPVLSEAQIPASGCAIIDTKKIFFIRTVNFPVRKRYPLKEIISHYIRRCIEGGLYQGLVWRDNPTRTFRMMHPDGGNEATFTEVDFFDVVPFLLLYATTTAISFGVLCLEMVIFHSKRRCCTSQNASWIRSCAEKFNKNYDSIY